MAKPVLSVPRVGGGKKVIALLVVLVLVTLVVKDPHGMADLAKGIGSGIGSAIDALVTFVRAL